MNLKFPIIFMAYRGNMFYRFIDYAVLFIAIVIAGTFGDHIGYHSWYVAAAILATNLVAFSRGLANREDL